MARYSTARYSKVGDERPLLGSLDAWLRGATVLARPRAPEGELVACPLCSARSFQVLGVRGNREHVGADPNAQPHVWTNVVRCTQCDFVFTNPMLPGTDALERAYYDDPVNYQASQSGDGATAMFGQRLALVAKHACRGRLLDVGAGKGEFLRVARDQGWQVEGVEPSPRFCRYASDQFGIRVHTGMLGEIPEIERGAFDAVTLNHVLEHVDRPKALLTLIAEYLREDGVLFIEVPNVDSMTARLADAYFRARRLEWSCRLSPIHPPFHKYGYTRASLRFVLEETGYEVLETATFSGRDRGVSSKHRFVDRMLIEAAFTGLSSLGNRELLCAVARPNRAHR